MVRERKQKNKIFYLRILFIIIMLVITLKIIRGTFARYTTTARSSANIELAYYLLEEQSISQNLQLESILPRPSAYVYEFSVANYRGNDRTQTALEYEIAIKTTTNLPLTFGVNKKNSATNLITSNQTATDSDGTIFRYITVAGDEFGFTQNQQNIYELKIYFTEEPNAEYEGIVEYIEITINSHQKINNTNTNTNTNTNST